MTYDYRFLKAFHIVPDEIDAPDLHANSAMHFDGISGVTVIATSDYNELEFTSATSHVAVNAAQNWCKRAQEADKAKRRWCAAFLVVWAAFLALGAWTIAHR